ncbi:deoxyribonuclease-1-like [Garra rufa]|uniref:deoxyribonuclease-1-like n=1 Tax=Garra rufa TaxID=137080 RepID=UPI003CCE97DE
MKIIIAIGLLLLSVHLGNSLMIGAFNIKAFGNAKTTNATLLNIITKVIRRYDVVVIQEVRDSDLTSTKRLMQSLNAVTPNQYQYIVSDLLGRSTYKERYLFVYRSQAVSVANSFHYDDGCEPCGNDTFSREPFVVKFSSNTTVRDFAIIPQHTSPELAVKEIDALHDVVLKTKQRLSTNNILLMGDFNAGCSYVSSTDWSKIRLRTDKSYTWLIADTVDTTVTTTHCPYDRIVATPEIMKGVTAGSAQVFDFMKAQGLSQSLALAVSDHFPIEVKVM